MPTTIIKAVVFDAAGTLLHPDPPAAEVYVEIGQQFGCNVDPQAISRVFSAAFARQEAVDRQAGWRTDETRELQRWRAIVAEVLHDANDFEACFAALYNHFQNPQNWRCEAAADTLAQLEKRGYKIALASNFDWRLRPLLAEMRALAGLRDVVISSEIGWRKPAPEFFAAVSRTVAAAPDEILHVGDDLINDYQGATTFGCHAVLFDPAGVEPKDVLKIKDLSEVLYLLNRLANVN